jgi:hypothetical protein
MKEKINNLATGGRTNRSCDDFKTREWDPEDDEEEEEDEDVEYEEDGCSIPADEDIPQIENYGQQHELADIGIGFLSSHFSVDEQVEGDIFVDEDAEEEEEEEVESTVGTLGWGRVVNGMDAFTEKKLYEEFVKVYGIPLRQRIADIVAITVISCAGVVGYFDASLDKSVIMMSLACLTCLVYIMTRK